MSDGVQCTWMRGGTSKGGFFLAKDLPATPKERDSFLLSVMGSPDTRQIDGMGGADPLTSKVAIVSPSSRKDTDVDYLFLQVAVDKVLVSDSQGCGNMLAGVGPFAIERGLVTAKDGTTPVRIYMQNTDSEAIAHISTPNKRVNYTGDASIDGVPGTAAAVPLVFSDIAGSNCGALFPSGSKTDVIDGYHTTLIDNGMPTVILLASEFGISGYESREALDANTELKTRLESVRLQAGRLMNLDDVSDTSVPKMTLVAPPKKGGVIMTRTFIPHRCHATIGVFCAISVATACVTKDTVAASIASIDSQKESTYLVEHALGATAAILNIDTDGNLASAGMLRTTRKLFEGTIYG